MLLGQIEVAGQIADGANPALGQTPDSDLGQAEIAEWLIVHGMDS